MRIVLLGFIVILASTVSGTLGYLFANRNYSNLQEEIISNEIRLIEAARKIKPTCESPEPYLVDDRGIGIFVVFLPIEDEASLIDKVIFDQEGHSAIETIESNCEN